MLPCCEKHLGPPERVDERDDLLLRRCAICGRRHFELTVDPGVLGLRGADL